MTNADIFNGLFGDADRLKSMKLEYESLKDVCPRFEQFLVAPDYYREKAKAEKKA